ncbi:hypothetical protein HAX54_004049 [Datura stramonium]|uniref:DNA2/NAM7 helicase helicase domain-containing protein n=1 Tax=Datura stramonium TaxID=4076 RepID=A0ABS8T6D7_DATST|nr:hypothetical protein [Datura stramonium]
MVGKVEKREKDCKRRSSILLIREFQALSAIRGIPLLPVILNPTSYDHCKYYGSSRYWEDPSDCGHCQFVAFFLPSGLQRSSNGDLKSNGMSCTASRQRICQAAAVARAWQDAALAKQLNEDLENDKPMGNCSKRRILICAQSNAAVDELVSRITSEGLYGSDGTMYKPYIVRVGNVKTVHPNSLPFFIDTLVDHRIAEEKMNAIDSNTDADKGTLTFLRSNLEKLVDTIKCSEAKKELVYGMGILIQLFIGRRGS